MGHKDINCIGEFFFSFFIFSFPLCPIPTPQVGEILMGILNFLTLSIGSFPTGIGR